MYKEFYYSFPFMECYIYSPFVFMPCREEFRTCVYKPVLLNMALYTTADEGFKNLNCLKSVVALSKQR